MLASKSVLQRPLSVSAPKPVLFRPHVNQLAGLSSSIPRFVCLSAGNATTPASKSTARPKLTLRDVQNQLEPELKEGEAPKPWIVSWAVIVALPAIGLLFVASLAFLDFKRMKEEIRDDHEAGFIAFAIATFCNLDFKRMKEETRDDHEAGFIAFAIATFCNLVDVVAHLVALVGLLYIHYSFGLPIPAEITHTADMLSPIIVLCSFLSATVGELLSAMRAAQAASMDDVGDYDQDMIAARA
eukprot:gene11524-34237_t